MPFNVTTNKYSVLFGSIHFERYQVMLCAMKIALMEKFWHLGIELRHHIHSTPTVYYEYFDCTFRYSISRQQFRNCKRTQKTKFKDALNCMQK